MGSFFGKVCCWLEFNLKIYNHLTKYCENKIYAKGGFLPSFAFGIKIKRSRGGEIGKRVPHQIAEMEELVDSRDLGSRTERCVGSNPTLGTKFWWGMGKPLRVRVSLAAQIYVGPERVAGLPRS